MSSFTILTPPTTPDDVPILQFPCDITLITFNAYPEIEFRGTKTREGVRLKVNDLIFHFKLKSTYMRTVAKHLVVYSLRDIYKQDFYSIAGCNDSTLFSEYSNENELFITYKGLDILACNLPNELGSFRDWLDRELDLYLNCYEEIDYDALGW